MMRVSPIRHLQVIEMEDSIVPSMAGLMNLRTFLLLKDVDPEPIFKQARASDLPLEEALIEAMEPYRIKAWKDAGKPLPPKPDHIWCANSDS
jgi:hypothetical protein